MFVESVRNVPDTPSALAYKLKKYHEFHIGNKTWRTVSRMPASVTEKSDPRKIADDSKYQRIASAP